MQKLLTFFSAKKISVYAVFNDQSFYDTLTNDIVSFEQLGPAWCLMIKMMSFLLSGIISLRTGF